jgi:mono/diheme cytochrome c family protein
VSRVVSLIAICAALGLRAGAAQPVPAQPSPEPTPSYRIECETDEGPCRADIATYIGWRVFQAQCASCHAADARGSSYAPDLTARLRGMEQREFFTALDRGYLGQRSTMPPRGRDPNVAPYYEQLWAFLTARRDGRLPAGRVEPLAVESRASP